MEGTRNDGASVLHFLLASFLLLGIGIYGLKHGFSFFVQKRQLQERLLAWNVFEQAQPQPQVVAAVERSWTYLHAWIALGAGSGGMLVMLAMLDLSSTIGGTVSDYLWTTTLPTASFYGACCIGGGLGAVIAAWRMRATAQGSLPPADWQERSLSMYRSGLLRFLPLLLIAWTLLITLIIVPRLTGIKVSWNADPVGMTVQNMWVLFVVPTGMLLLFVAIETALSRLARLSRLLVTSDSLVSQRVDDMLRAHVIGLIQGFAFAAIGYLLYVQHNVLLESMTVGAHSWPLTYHPYTDLLALTLPLALAMTIFGFLGLSVQGRLGGKITGWPWQSRKTL